MGDVWIAEIHFPGAGWLTETLRREGIVHVVLFTSAASGVNSPQRLDDRDVPAAAARHQSSAIEHSPAVPLYQQHSRLQVHSSFSRKENATTTIFVAEPALFLMQTTDGSSTQEKHFVHKCSYSLRVVRTHSYADFH